MKSTILGLRLALALLAVPPVARAAEGSAAPVATKTPAPDHPPELFQQGVAGEAVIECIVNPEGRVGEAKIVSASRPEFGEAALAAVKQWEFKPGEKDGAPAAMRVTIPFSFQVPGDHPLEKFAKRRLFIDVEGEVVPAENMPKWPMPKQLLTPNYPDSLKGSGKRGKAVVSVVIDRAGRVINPKIVKATWPEFEMPALAAAVSLQFAPQLGPDKKPVNVAMDLQFDFRDDARPSKKSSTESKAKAGAGARESGKVAPKD
ncbi:MAG TPA: TonB family protein [Opitutaceae bacterium]|nr:TonB family protein [Opitutaceae bacterium]